MIVGYARVGTHEHELERRRDALKTADRPELARTEPVCKREARWIDGVDVDGVLRHLAVQSCNSHWH